MHVHLEYQLSISFKLRSFAIGNVRRVYRSFGGEKARTRENESRNGKTGSRNCTCHTAALYFWSRQCKHSKQWHTIHPRKKRRLDREKRFSVQAVVHASDDRAWFSPNHTRSRYRARLARRARLSTGSRGTPFRRSARGPSRAHTRPLARVRSRDAASRPPPV